MNKKVNMKSKFVLNIITVACLFVLAGLLTVLIWVKSVGLVGGTKCLRIPVQTNAVIYTESNSATNIVALVKSNDFVYLCGE